MGHDVAIEMIDHALESLARRNDPTELDQAMFNLSRVRDEFTSLGAEIAALREENKRLRDMLEERQSKKERIC